MTCLSRNVDDVASLLLKAYLQLIQLTDVSIQTNDSEYETSAHPIPVHFDQSWFL